MKLVIAFLLLLSNFSFSQSKYLIYFKDKGINKNEILSKKFDIYKKAFNALSEKAIERRQKVLGDDLITYEDLPINPAYINQIESIGIEIKNKLKWFNAVSAFLTDEQFEKLKSFDFIEKIDGVKIYKKRDERLDQPKLNKPLDTNDNNYGQSFQQLDLSHIPLIHKKGITGKGVRIGVLDSGFDWKNHEALKNSNVIAEYDYIFSDSVTANESGDVSNQDDHGTFVFSVISGMMQGKLIGSAYDAEFVLAKTEDVRSETHVEEDNYAAALEWMEGLGVDITSSSLGYSEFDSQEFSYEYKDMDGKSTIVTKAAELAFQRGVLTITSAGNEGNSSWYYITAPADGINTIAVGAVSSNGQLASFSSRGPSYDGRIKPDISTQGVGVYGAAAGSVSSYSSSSGTSAACPIASGSAALILSAFPHLKNVQLRDLIHQSGDSSLTPNNRKGYGILLVDKALKYPNIEKISSNEIFVHKAFIDENGIQSGSPKIHFSTTDSNFAETIIPIENETYSKFNLTTVANNGEIYFYYSYKDSLGNNKREPGNGYFKTTVGDEKIVILTEIDSEPVIPTAFELKQNYPNPFNGETTIRFNAVVNEIVTLSIFDAIGRQIYKEEKLSKIGTNEFRLNENNINWLVNSSGVYYYVLSSPTVRAAKKMIFLK